MIKVVLLKVVCRGSLAVYEKELKSIEGVKLYPGMSATVMMPTIERTAFDYLVGPLARSRVRCAIQLQIKGIFRNKLAVGAAKKH
ncbi:MAG TPA: hypothetical protein VKH62_11805 [Candidatus Binatia bacterium]|jgi:hypothetical protein|nr:hypothetical protein [Candidatus Binatia bacterium]